MDRAAGVLLAARLGRGARGLRRRRLARSRAAGRRRARPAVLYLCGDGSIARRARRAPATAIAMTRAAPIPTLGGRNMLIDAGPRDQRPVQALPDYGLIYERRAARRGFDHRRPVSRAAPRRIRLPGHRLHRQAHRSFAGRARHAADGRRRPRDLSRSAAAARGNCRRERLRAFRFRSATFPTRFAPATGSGSTSPAAISRAAPATRTAATRCSRTTPRPISAWRRTACTTRPRRPPPSSFRC